MLKFEWRRVPEGACPVCNGSGIVIPKGGEMPIEAGSFCSACDEGLRRWHGVMDILESAKL